MRNYKVKKISRSCQNEMRKRGDIFLEGLMKEQTARDYELLYDIIRRRSSIRKLKPDPIPDQYITKILEAGRWAMSGANSQPWEYIVVKDAKVKKDLGVPVLGPDSSRRAQREHDAQPPLFPSTQRALRHDT